MKSTAKAKAGNEPNRASLRSGLLNSSVIKERAAYVRAVCRGQPSRAAELTEEEVKLQEEAAKLIPYPRRIQVRK